MNWIIQRVQNILSTIFGLVLIAYFCFLLATNYVSQVNLHKTALEQLRHNTEKRANAVSYFFSERKNNIENLAANRVMSVFFENKALEMSMKYGLRANLFSIFKHFQKLIDEKTIRGAPVFTRMVFIDRDGKCLIDSDFHDLRQGQRRRSLIKLISPESREAIVVAESSKILISAPIISKNNFLGNVIAQINIKSLYDHLIKSSAGPYQFIGLASGNGNFYLPEEMPLNFLYSGLHQLRKLKTGETSLFDLTHNDEPGREMIAIKVQIKDTPLYLFNVLPSSDVIGTMSPWHLLVVMGLLSFFFLAGMVFLWRINSKNLILQARFDEASKQSEEIDRKNKELKEEVGKRKNAEQQIKNYSQNLENMVGERTAELKEALDDLKNTQSQLIQSEKMASIGQLAAGVAHEINNPVGFVKSNLGTIDEYRIDMMKLLDQYQTFETTLAGENELNGNGPVADKLRDIQTVKDEIDLDFILDDYQQVIGDSIEGMERITKIVADLKNFAHVDKAELEHTDINKGIESTLNIVWNELKYKATVEKDFGDVPLVKCYPQRINQVIMNILVNAAHAIEDKGEIQISTRADNGNVEIEISDTGSGIPPEIVSKIFDPFFTTKDVGKGTGLGLNVAYNIIKKHKGTIEVESEVGKGTTFIVRLQTEPDLVE